MRMCLMGLSLFLLVNVAESRELLVENLEGFNNAVQTVLPGDEIVLRDGVWRDVQLVFKGVGTQTAPITLRAETPGKVILAGQSQLQIAGEYLVVDGLWFKDGGIARGNVIAFRGQNDEITQNCRLTNTAITDYNAEANDVNCKWVSLYGRNNRVDHCYFRGQEGGGQTLVVWVEDYPNDHRIDHNHFGGRVRLGQNGGETLRIGTSSVSMNLSRTVVESNLFENCDGEIEIVSNKSCGNVYRRNTFRACDGMFTLRHGNDCVVEENFFLGDGIKKMGGVRIIGENHRVVNNYFEKLRGTGARSAMTLVEGIPNAKLNEYWQVKRALIAYNTFVDCAQVFELGNGKGSRNRSLPPLDVVVANNLIIGTEEQELVRLVEEKSDIWWLSNLYWGLSSSLGKHRGMILADPSMSKAQGLFRPSPSGLAIDRAVGQFGVVHDIDGQMRQGVFDIGCDQAVDETIHSRPLNAEDVGVAWRDF